MSVPMMVREKAVGVINSYTSVPHTFTSEEVKLLQAIAITLLDAPRVFAAAMARVYKRGFIVLEFLAFLF